MTTLTEKREARNAVAVPQTNAADIATMVETVLIKGDLSKLNPQQRDAYYLKLCEVTGLNPLMQPFDYLTLNNKLVLYAKKEAAAQLRALHGISVVDMDHDESEGIHSVTVKVQNAKGRVDMDTGSVKVAGLQGEPRANAIMKAVTKAKRRATLSICGLGLLDETEIETIPGASAVPNPAPEAGEAFPHPPASRPRTNPNSSNQLKKNGAWDSFIDRIQGFIDAHDLDGLKQWYASPEVNHRIANWPQQWRESAEEEFERAHDLIKRNLELDK